MGNLQGQLVLVAVLVLLNAAFAGSEIALVSLREGQLQRLERSGTRGRVLAALAREPNRFLATIQIGITLAGFLASATAAVSLAEPLVEPLSFLGTAAGPVAVALVTIVLAYLTLVLGELAPKRLAMQRSEGWSLLVARPLSLMATAARPIVWFLGRSTDLVVKLAGGDPHAQGEDVSDEELRDLLMTRQTFSRPQRRILSETFELFERTVNQIAVPRTDVMLVQADLPAGQTVDALVAGGHSRAPVCEDDLDSVVGVVHLQDVVHRGGTARDCARPPLALPETLGVLDALRRMQAERQHLAIVIDEHGGSAGILTLEDVLEELVGEIFDEFDPDTRAARRDDDGSLHVVGSFPVHDLPDLGVELPSGPYATIAGLILHRLGRLPTGGETVEVGGWRLTVEEVQGRAISKVWLQATDV